MAGHPTAGKNGGYATDYRIKRAAKRWTCTVCELPIDVGDMYERHYGMPIHPKAYFEESDGCRAKRRELLTKG